MAEICDMSYGGSANALECQRLRRVTDHSSGIKLGNRAGNETPFVRSVLWHMMAKLDSITFELRMCIIVAP
jgi:hypothetical protein